MSVRRRELEAADPEHKVVIKRELIRLSEVLYFDVEVLDPYDKVKYLGVWVQPAIFTARAATEATRQAEEVAGALATTTIELLQHKHGHGRSYPRGSQGVGSCIRH